MISPAQHDAGFSWPVRVYYEDTDSFGVVYYANYFRFLERARTEWLRSLGVDQVSMGEHGCVFVVRSVQGEYLKSARFNDALEVRSRITAITRVAVDFEQNVFRGDERLFEGSVRVICVNPVHGRPVSIPVTLRANLVPSPQS